MSREIKPGKDIYDVVIIGGGPAGLSAAIYTARASLKTLIIDKSPASGALGSAHKIANYPGVPGEIPGTELLALFRGQAESFGASVVRDQAVGVNFSETPREIFTNRGGYYGRTVIIATGSMGRKPGIPGEEEFRGRGVSYCATCDAAFFKGKTVAAAGELPEILEELDAVAQFAGKVHVIIRNEEITEEQAARLKEHAKVALRTGSHIVQIRGSEVVESILLGRSEGDEETLEVSGLFLYLKGNQPVTDFLYDSLEAENGCLRLNHEDMSTSAEGVFAVGDVTCRKIRQVVLSCAEGCVAALSAERYLRGQDRARSQWSGR